METQTVRIPLPPIRDDDAGYKYLSKLADFITSSPNNIYIFDFSKCSIISHNGLVVIGGLCNYLKQNEKSRSMFNGFGLKSLLYTQKKIQFSIEKISPRLMERLQELGFWDYVQPDYGIVGSSDYIGYRQHDTVLNDSQIVDHLKDSWLTNEKLSVSESLKAEIVSSIYEIFINAYGHGLKDNHNQQSVISCGYYEPKEKKLSLSVLDLGGGIVNSVQKHIPLLGKEAAFSWALQVGNSTRTDSAPDLPRGLGFGILKAFVMINGGVLRVCSDSYMATVNPQGIYVTKSVPGRLLGTLVSITVNCDDKHYKFKSESDELVPNFF
jgi:anti-sigma regulatory factor (Ser/Thr protein kinase)